MEEKENISEIVASYPAVFVGSAIGGIIIESICLIVCILTAPPEQKVLLTTLLLFITTILLIVSIALKRYKVVVDKKGILEIPLLGKSKYIGFSEIESISIKGSKAISIKGNGLKIYIDPSAVGYKEIFVAFYENGLIKASRPK